MRALAVGSLLALLLGLGYVGLADGGAPEREREGGGLERSALVERWSLVSSGPDDAAGLLCDETMGACDPARLRDRAARGHACAWSGTFWLAGSGTLLVREPTILVYAVIESGDGRMLSEGTRNHTTSTTTFPLAWPDGDWWRPESVRVHVALPVPCDAARLRVTLNVEGRTLDGGMASTAQGTEVTLVPIPSH